ncbi:MAG: YgiT-type zinc finger protein [Chlorobium sp.]|nr:MAG: YgiT-type zinc finger protein [Chlorobium sp.]
MFHCHNCGSNKAREEIVDEVFKLDEKHVLVEGIPAKVCVRCGDKTFSRETTENIRRIIHGHLEPAKSVPMDVFEYV